jgi:hypothetical protein
VGGFFFVRRPPTEATLPAHGQFTAKDLQPPNNLAAKVLPFGASSPVHAGRSRGATMPNYRAYIFGIDGHRFVVVDGFLSNHPDDAAALAAAKKLIDGHDIEVWDEGRLVARLDHKTGNPISDFSMLAEKPEAVLRHIKIENEWQPPAPVAPAPIAAPVPVAEQEAAPSDDQPTNLPVEITGTETVPV